MNVVHDEVAGRESLPPKPRLLLVDADPDLGLALSQLLAVEYEVEHVTDGEAAWTAAQRQAPALIVADVALPSLNGIELTARLRAEARFAGVAIILATAKHQPGLLLKAHEAGIDDFLFKPFKPEELFARLRCQLRLVGLRREAFEQSARAEAEAIERARRRFLASLSHELRLPLDAIHLALNMVSQTEGLPDAAREVLTLIKRNVDAEARLISNLIDYSHLLHDKLEFTSGRVDVHDCLGRAVKMCREDYAPKHLNLTVDLAAERYEVVGDDPRLEQVFCSLLRHVGRLSPAVGKVQLRSTNTEREIVVEVEYEGLSVPAELLSRLFVPFEPLLSCGRPLYEGQGLELALAHAIVAAHDGRLTARPAESFEGVILQVRLPTMPVTAGTPGILSVVR